MKKKYLIAIIATIVIVVGIVAVKIKSNSNELVASNKNETQQSSKPISSESAKNLDKSKNIDDVNKDSKLTETTNSKNKTKHSTLNETSKNTDKNVQSDKPKSNTVKANTIKNNKSNEANNNKLNETNKDIKEKKLITKEEFVKAILKKELENQSLPKYIIPIRAVNNNYNKLEKFSGSDGFLCNDDGKLDDGILVGLGGFNPSDNVHGFVIKDYDAIRNGGHGLVDRGTISNNGEVKFSM